LLLGFVVLTPDASAAVAIDRAVVRYVASETGGVQSPRFIFERELAFESRLEALGDPSHANAQEEPFRSRHVRAALERHIAETLLESLPIDPEPSEAELGVRIDEARVALYQRAGGAQAVEAAARNEGVDRSEIARLLRRQARASLYLDRMIAPMLSPSDSELLTVHRTLRTPFAGRPFEDVREELGRWYVGLRLSEALAAFYDGARSRLHVVVLH
jgi:hypothetical protein